MTRPPEAEIANSLLASQRRYYDLRAPDYDDETRPPDRKLPGHMPLDMVRDIVEALSPRGDVLELACGPGTFTAELLRHASRLTAVDASPRMLQRNRARVADQGVTYINADLFTWTPDRHYDFVFFSFWLSHVPPSAFETFWELVRSCVHPDGRVAFVDEDDRGLGVTDEPYVVGGVPAARRTLADGQQFDIVKLFWHPDELRVRLRQMGWDFEIQRVGETFMWGVGRPT